jgi:hypothetical protein
MITLLLAATLLPEAAACDPAPAQPIASYPVASAGDTALKPAPPPKNPASTAKSQGNHPYFFFGNPTR